MKKLEKQFSPIPLLWLVNVQVQPSQRKTWSFPSTVSLVNANNMEVSVRAVFLQCFGSSNHIVGNIYLFKDRNTRNYAQN